MRLAAHRHRSQPEGGPGGTSGHSSIQVTYDRYGYLFPSDQEALAAQMDEVYHDSLTDTRRTPGGHRVVELPAQRTSGE